MKIIFISQRLLTVYSATLGFLCSSMLLELNHPKLSAQELNFTERSIPSLPALPESRLPLLSGTENWSSDYRLGPGDFLNVSVFAAEEYGSEVLVRQNGSINLPQIGSIVVGGLTLQQTTEVLIARYAIFIREPIVNVQPIRFRPVQVGIAGEVGRPGSYVVAGPIDESFPTLTQAIAQAGGITSEANLRELEIRRDVGGGRKQALVVDLWTLIQSGNLDEDVILIGGDEIFIPTAIALTPTERRQLSRVSFAPETIQVYVAGEVESPGVIDVPLNTTLNQGVLAAGGFNPRAKQNIVELLRLDADGTASQQLVEINFAAGIDSAENPILKDQDVIIVNRSSIAKTSDTTDLLLSPFTRAINVILGIFRLFN